MPFRLLGFSCWDDRSGRFFFTVSVSDSLIRSTAPTAIFPRNGHWAQPQTC
jgi:hypothetical protein